MREVTIARDPAELNRLAAEKFVTIAEESIDSRGRFAVALSGGSTPKALFRLLASEPYRSQVDWENVLFFFGDERNVPPDSDDSNFRMARENLFDALSIPDKNIFRWKTELGDPDLIAADYQQILASRFNTKPPVFDLILLGMGPDGHTASLFPKTPALDESDQIAVANPVQKINTVRLTLTYPVINAARNIAFLVAGFDKADMLSQVLEGNADLHELPSRGVKPKTGRLYWFVDAAAAKELSA